MDLNGLKNKISCGQYFMNLKMRETVENNPTLYEWAGDLQAFERLFTGFYDKVLKGLLLATWNGEAVLPSSIRNCTIIQWGMKRLCPAGDGEKREVIICQLINSTAQVLITDLKK